VKRIDPEIVAALEDTGKPFAFERGGKHLKIKLDGRLVGVLSNGAATKNWREIKNTIAQIRRAARGA
jgi:hypothetical protein